MQATVLYSNGLVNFYHAFDQPKIMDRQEMRLQFERGEITLYEWVPTRLVLTALCSKSELQELRLLFTSAEVLFSSGVMRLHKWQRVGLNQYTITIK